MDRGIWQDRGEAERTTINDLLDRYAHEILPTKRGDAGKVMPHIRALKAGLGEKSLAALSARDVAEYRDARLSNGLKTQTVRYDLALLSRAIKQGMVEWDIALPAGNPVLNVRMPAPSKPRDRRLAGGEEERMLAALAGCENPYMRPLMLIALETAAGWGNFWIFAGKTSTFPERQQCFMTPKMGMTGPPPSPALRLPCSIACQGTWPGASFPLASLRSSRDGAGHENTPSLRICTSTTSATKPPAASSRRA